MADSSNPFEDAPVIFSYTRKQAIEDGVLVDLTSWARETGFVIPVACTAEVWHRCIEPPAAALPLGQSARGRAHDLLWMLYVAIRSRESRALAEGKDLLYYEVLFQQEPEKTIAVGFKAHCGPGDQGEPVLTIMLPDED